MTAHVSAERLSLYLDAALEPAVRRRVERHLEGCPDCRHRLAGLERVVAGLARLPAGAPPADLAAQVGRAIELDRERGSWLDLRLPRPLAGMASLHLFALVLALAAIVYMFALGVERGRQRPTRIVLPGATAGLAVPEGAPAGDAEPLPLRSDRLRLLGGLFQQVEGVWVEVGLGGRAPDERIVLRRPLGPDAVPELESLPSPLRFVVDGRVVEVEIGP